MPGVTAAQSAVAPGRTIRMDSILNAILLGAVVAVGLSAAINLFLIFAVTRRIAAMEARSGTGAPAVTPVAGHRVGDFGVRTLAGRALTHGDLTGTATVVVFLSPGCPPCETMARSLAAGLRPRGLPMLVFVAAPGADLAAELAGELADSLAADAQVAVILQESTIAEAFGVGGYPTALRIEDGVVAAASNRLDAIAPLETAAHA